LSFAGEEGRSAFEGDADTDISSSRAALSAIIEDIFKLTNHDQRLGELHK
jgi:hypothetical protein